MMKPTDEQIVAAMLKAKELGVKMLASDCEQIIQALLDKAMPCAAVAFRYRYVDGGTWQYTKIFEDTEMLDYLKNEYPQFCIEPLYTSPQPAEGYVLVNEIEYNLLKERADIDHKRQLAYWKVLVAHNLTDPLTNGLLNKAKPNFVGFDLASDKDRTVLTNTTSNESMTLPEGYALVPIEPTQKMWEASEKYLGVVFNTFSHAYKAMINEAMKG